MTLRLPSFLGKCFTIRETERLISQHRTDDDVVLTSAEEAEDCLSLLYLYFNSLILSFRSICILFIYIYCLHPFIPDAVLYSIFI